jgi:hypothetical protein
VGEALECFYLIDDQIPAGLRKAIETYHFRPRYAPTASRGRLANLGHPSSSCWILAVYLA